MGKKKLIMISGGSGGIGKLLLKNLSKKYKILYLYNRNKPSFIKSAKYLKIDFSKPKQVKNACTKLKQMTLSEKKIIYLNLAATKNDKISINIKMREISETFNVNCFSLFQIIQAILPNLIKNRWGRVINISSTGGLAGEIGTMLYTSSKNATPGKVYQHEARNDECAQRGPRAHPRRSLPYRNQSQDQQAPHRHRHSPASRSGHL